MTLVAILALPVAAFELRPYQGEYVWGFGDLGSSQARVQYVPGESYAALFLEIDNVRRWDDVTYRVSWSEPWAPQWQGQINNQVEGRVRFEFQFVTAEPLDSERAIRLLNGLRVNLTGDGRDVTVSYAAQTGWERWDLPEAFKYWWFDRWLTVPKYRGVPRAAP